MKIIILLFTILLVSCEGSSSGESSEKTAEVGNPAGTINLTNLTDLGLYDNGSLMLRSDCFFDGETYKETEINIYDADSLVMQTKEYNNENCIFSEGQTMYATFQYTWHMDFTEVDGVITANVTNSRMTTLQQSVIDNGGICGTNFSGNIGQWDDIDYSECEFDKTGEEITINLEDLGNGGISVDGIIYTVN